MYKVKYNLFDVHPSFKVGIDLVIIEDEVVYISTKDIANAVRWSSG